MFPEKIEFDGEKYRTNSYNKVLDLIFQQTNELRGNKKKKEKEFLLSPTQYPDPVKYPANKVYPNEAKCMKIIGSPKWYIAINCTKKTIFCRFWLPFGYPDLRKCLPLRAKEIKSKRVWHRKRR